MASDLPLLFDEETHTYTCGDRVVPSVTQILKPWSKIGQLPAEVLAPAAERGKNVHLITQFWDEDALDMDSVSEELAGYLEAWKKFRKAYDFRPEQIEQRVFERKFWYAGTFDRRGTIRSRSTGPRRKALIDIKSGVFDPTHGPQTAAYAKAHRCETDLRMSVYLGADGEYSTSDGKPEDWSVFLAALIHHNWRAKHGI